MELPTGHDHYEGVAELIAAFANTATNGHDLTGAARSKQRSSGGFERRRKGGSVRERRESHGAAEGKQEI